MTIDRILVTNLINNKGQLLEPTITKILKKFFDSKYNFKELLNKRIIIYIIIILNDNNSISFTRTIISTID